VHGAVLGHLPTLQISLESLLIGALQHSSQVRVFSDLPLIRETAVVEAEAAFDWTAFVQTRWDDVSEPVGNSLTIGDPNATRFRDHVWSGSAGARRRSLLGGQFEIAQELGFQNNNSVFFIPQDQGTARLKLSYTQPLLRGAGEVYNSSLIVLAQIDTGAAYDEFSRQLQTHLLEVTRGYWGLYLERGALLQKRRLLASAESILDELEQRREIDALESQLVRARAAVESRRADLARAETAVRNGESRVRALVNDPALGSVGTDELIPTDAPLVDQIPVDMQESLVTAMQNRPEIAQAIKQVKAAGVRLEMSRNELLPLLNVVLETYASGLRGETDIGGSWTDQFSKGEPSYGIGLQYEMPFCNQAARARFERRNLELRQVRNQFQTTVHTLRLEVEVAVREVETAFREMLAKYRAMKADLSEVEYIRERWRLLPGEDRAASLVLEDLLSAQERLTESEFGFLSAQLTYNLALTSLKRATGTLLQYEDVHTARACVDCLPTLLLHKPLHESVPAPASETTPSADDTELPAPMPLPDMPDHAAAALSVPNRLPDMAVEPAQGLQLPVPPRP